ncbi:MAG: polyhydroxyalkanoic acid system family protein [Acidobacteria bacterium]|nr:polyhydroxyalkanoic acid system family protein [Acidobacteriota bacterium]MBI3279468.1 polyhydroxyalkanoic acid system family protein [Acidobacteriota bacterium]
MRITVPHRKPVPEVIRLIDQSADEFFTGLPVMGLQIVETRKEWSGPNMKYSFIARLAFATLPVSGSVYVSEREVTIEVDLPPLLARLLPEEKVRESIQSRVKGLLGGPTAER